MYNTLGEKDGNIQNIFLKGKILGLKHIRSENSKCCIKLLCMFFSFFLFSVNT